MIITEEEYLAHYGILRKSGRYPWGSGDTQSQRNRSFLDTIENEKKQGLSEAVIAKGHGMTTSQLRASKSIAINQLRQDNIRNAQRLADKGMSPTAIGRQMGINESSVRSLLAPGSADKADVLETTSNMLRDQVDSKGYVDIGSGVENHVGVTRTKFDTAVAILQEDGYEVHNVEVLQVGTGNKTKIKVLAKPGTTQKDVWLNRNNIQPIQEHSEDGGRSYLGIKPPLSIKSNRIAVRYAEDGGAKADGVIYIRPGKEDISIGKARYAQVRIAVDGTHYLKGMAVYKDDLPDGVDLMFNTNKSDTGNKKDAMKALKDEPDNPFGSTVRQILDEKGNVKSAMNIVGQKEGSGEEGSWDLWSRSLPAQMLSKQNPTLVKTQLKMTYDDRRRDYEAISELTNATVRKKLLETFADETDSASVHLKAAAIPNQATKVLLPISKIKEGEIYAPSFRDGDRVALVRFPHGGTFEIPQLTVNNRNPEARKLLGTNAVDAVGIHHTVAERLSGADFDGDTVLVIPNNRGQIKSTPPLDGLKGFDPQTYKIPDGSPIPKMTPSRKGHEMGNVTNLIADMTIHGATTEELARAIRHSMVVIDAEKHGLDYRASARDNGISQLKTKYQGGPTSGASTLITRASSKVAVPDRKPRSAAKGGPVDKATGKKVFENTDATYVDRKTGETVSKVTRVKRLANTDDAHTLSSGTPIEIIYADHSNNLKALANEARKDAVNTKSKPYSPSAKAHYPNEVASLNAKLDLVYRNRPLERNAQVLANGVVHAKRQANPNMDDAELKKIKSQALMEARRRTGAEKTDIVITDSEWNAIQAGAISNHKLEEILNKADIDTVRKLATPRANTVMTSSKQVRAEQMLASGYTQAAVADALGVSLSTLKSSISRGET